MTQRGWCVIDIVSPYSYRSTASYGAARICRPAGEGESATIVAIKVATELYGPEVVVSCESSTTKAMVRARTAADGEGQTNCVRVRMVQLENVKGKLRQQLGELAVREEQDGEGQKDKQIAALQEENAVLLAQLKSLTGESDAPRVELPPQYEKRPSFWKGWRRREERAGFNDAHREPQVAK